MKLIDRHLLREFLIPVMYCLLAFAMILIIGELFGDMQRIINARPSPHVVVRFYISIMGPYMLYLTPASLMLATLYTLHGLTRNNELIAMRASGISIYRIMVPFLAVGFTFSLGIAALNEIWTPHAAEWAEEIREHKFHRVVTNITDRCIYLNPTASRQWVIQQFDRKHPQHLEGVEVKEETPDGQRKRIITAKKAEYLDGQWWFYGPYVQRFGDHDNPIGDPIPLGATPTSVVEMRHYNESPSVFVSTTRAWPFLNIREMRHFLKTHSNLSPRATAKKRYSLHSKLAMPWACLIVILFAIPAGTRTGRQSMLTAVFTAIGLMASFYALAQVGLIMGSTGMLRPWIGAWLSHIVFGTIGIILLARIR